ncbi:hypothetical protein [Lysobacter gummosus]
MSGPIVSDSFQGSASAGPFFVGRGCDAGSVAALVRSCMRCRVVR